MLPLDLIDSKLVDLSLIEAILIVLYQYRTSIIRQ